MTSVTIEDIAKHVGVTKATVSLVLSGKRPMIRISDGTRQKVLQAARDLHYVPSLTARALARGKTNSLGLVVGDIHSFYFSELASMALHEADARGYHLLISATEWHRDRELEKFDFLLQRRVDGIIMSTSALRPGLPQYDYVMRHQFPVVTTEEETEGLPCINHDWTTGMTQAIAYLAQKGHTRVGFVAQADRLAEKYPKLQAFLAACAEKKVEPVIYECSVRIEDARRLGKSLAGDSGRPRAVIVYSDFLANAFIRGLRDTGLQVPHDLAVVGMDGTDMSEYSYLQLTSIASDRKQMAVQAVELLLDMINTKQILAKRILLPTNLVIRESA